MLRAGAGSSSGNAGLLSSCFFVYVILNESKRKAYIGQTNNWEKRLKRHNGELPSNKNSYTSVNKGDWKIVYIEEYNTRSEALKREKYLKSHRGRD